VILALLLAANAVPATHGEETFWQPPLSIEERFPIDRVAPSVRLTVYLAFEPPRMITLSRIGKRWRVEHITSSSIRSDDPKAVFQRRVGYLVGAQHEALERALSATRGSTWPRDNRPPHGKICLDGWSFVLTSTLDDQPVVTHRMFCDIDPEFMALARAIADAADDHGTPFTTR
jgi:hypothetical protein